MSIYLIIGVVVGFYSTLKVYRWLDKELSGDTTDTAFNALLAFLAGMIAAIFWPITLLFVAFHIFVKRIRTPEDKEKRHQ